MSITADAATIKASSASTTSFAAAGKEPVAAATSTDNSHSSATTRLSYAQVAQHNKERLNQDNHVPNEIQNVSPVDKVTDKVADKEYKRKDLSPNSANTHANDQKDRSGTFKVYQMV